VKRDHVLLFHVVDHVLLGLVVMVTATWTSDLPAVPRLVGFHVPSAALLCHCVPLSEICKESSYAFVH
jgi:hypothetical protein